MKDRCKGFMLTFFLFLSCAQATPAFAQAPLSVTSGSAITITASEAGLDAFRGEPLLFLRYPGATSRSAGALNLTLLTAASRFRGQGTTEILCRCPHKTPAGPCELWIVPMQMPHLLEFQRLHDGVTAEEPEIINISRCPGPDERDTYILEGRFFGMNPEVRVLYDADGILGSIACAHVPPLSFPDALGRPESRCMDPFSGESRLKVIPDEALPVDTDLWLELKSGTGCIRHPLERKLRSDVTLTLKTEPADLGNTSPAPGEYRIPMDKPFEISALPIHDQRQKGYFAGWRLEGAGSVLEVPDGSAFATLSEDATVTALFSPRPDITVQAEPAGGGIVEGGFTEDNDLRLNKAFTIIAAPSAGFHFSHWETDDNIRVNDSHAPDTQASLTRPRSAVITARFVQDTENVFFRGLRTASLCTALDESSGTTVSAAWVSWERASCAGTDPERMTYHIYMGTTKDPEALARPENRIESVVGSTSALIPVSEGTGIRYFLVRAEAGNGAFSELSTSLPAEQGRLTLRRVPKFLTDVVSGPITYSEGKLTFDGDYSDRFETDDFLIYADPDSGLMLLRRITLVYTDGSLTILGAREATMDQVVREGELNFSVTWNCLDDSPYEEFPFQNALYPGIDLVYGIRFRPTLMINARYDADGLESLETGLTGPLNMDGELRLDLEQTHEYSGNHTMPLITRRGAFHLTAGSLPVYTNNAFTLFGGITFNARDPLSMTAPLALETEISAVTTWSRNGGWRFSGDSVSPVHTLTCSIEAFHDAEVDLHLSTQFSAQMFTKQFLLTTSDLQFSVDMAPEEGTMNEFERFDIYHAHSMNSTSLFKPFQDDSGNSGSQYETLFPAGERIFSLPEIGSFSGGEVVVSHDYRVSPVLTDGINNPICEDGTCNIHWRIDPAQYQVDLTVYPPYYDEMEKYWLSEVVFVPSRLRSYTLSVDIKGNGFLGDLGLRRESATITAILPPDP